MTNANGAVEISVVIPCYQSAGTIGPLLARLRSALSAVRATWEIVLVDDGSPDATWEVIQKEVARDAAGLIAIRLMRNFGQHNALMCGFAQACGDVVLTMDDDLQNPPEEIGKMLRKLGETGADVVYGHYGTKQHRPWRNTGSWLVNTFYRHAFKSEITVTSFRAIRRPVISAILRYDLNFTYVDGLIAWNTQRVAAVNVNHAPRVEGSSGYSIGKLATLAFNLFTNFSLLPLQVVMWTGTLLAMGGFGVGVFYLWKHLRNEIAVPGYASTITAILVLGGAQLVALGVIGEYLGRLHLNVNRKPQYSIRTVLAGERKAGEPRSASG